ncbi:NAD(P)-dependent alcohol dehydrogenase [Salinibacterium sp. G-O1]|uniref:NAD(P)-dependent alcohol dehydrogenase n=1 Tax=Salinibacterium sp. G-O1 TaxID=3046208 RepID=UPI0024BB57F6|nr:NAD(P)-dependent alcohol dehydrogenase [Salinibacterium sp. G-O1]MDJ0335890.1 NAD(P)-dependent alcohol dehydrogenase [Salinibacterium sp. G-O1]
MKAIVQDEYGPVGVLSLREIEAPTPGPNEVLIRVHAAGVNPADWHLMTGLPQMARIALGLSRPKNPVRGMDVAGVVHSVGSAVTAFRTGDSVFGIAGGSFAEFAKASTGTLALMPESLTFVQGAAIPMAACTALHAVRDAGLVSAGKRVMVIGAGGGIGTFAVQLAIALGATVTGVCSTSKVDLVRSLGAEGVIDYTMNDLSGHPPFDVIIDTAGNRPLSELRSALTERGRIVIVGAEGGGKFAGNTGRQFTAMLAPFARQKTIGLISTETSADLESLLEFVAAGTVHPVIDREYPLAEAAAAITRMTDGLAHGKIVLTV